jgi:hypothetical protein
LLEHGLQVGQFAYFSVYGDSAVLICYRGDLAADYLWQPKSWECDAKYAELDVEYANP